MSIFNNLSEYEKKLLLDYPIYISLLASNKDGGLDKEEKDAAIELYKIKTHVSNPLLEEYYSLEAKQFENRLLELNSKLPMERTERNTVIKKELESLSRVLLKVDGKYSQALTTSMQTFKEHVSTAHRNALSNFIFPIPIQGLSD
jgi:hypothetical protein